MILGESDPSARPWFLEWWVFVLVAVIGCVPVPSEPSAVPVAVRSPVATPPPPIAAPFGPSLQEVRDVCWIYLPSQVDVLIAETQQDVADGFSKATQQEGVSIACSLNPAIVDQGVVTECTYCLSTIIDYVYGY